VFCTEPSQKSWRLEQVYQARLKAPGVSGYVIRSLKIRDLRLQGRLVLRAITERPEAERDEAA
jgi:hypothetical protein